MFDYINGVDIFFFIVFVGVIILGLHRGPLVELFKLLAAFCATFVCLHYYVKLAIFFHKFSVLSRAAHEVLAFLFLWLVVVIFFLLLRIGVLLLLGKREETPVALSLVTLFLAGIRGVLVCGLIFFAILLSARPAWVKVTHQALVAVVLKDLSVGLYQDFCKRVLMPIFPSEEPNERVLVVRDAAYLEN